MKRYSSSIFSLSLREDGSRLPKLADKTENVDSAPGTPPVYSCKKRFKISFYYRVNLGLENIYFSAVIPIPLFLLTMPLR